MRNKWKYYKWWKKKLYIKFFKSTEFGANFIVKDLNGKELGIYKWNSKNYNSQLWYLNDFTKVSATIINNDTLKNIRIIKK